MKELEDIKIIECQAISLVDKDIIEIKTLKDFKYIIGSSDVFRLKEAYYLLSDTVAYIWKPK